MSSSAAANARAGRYAVLLGRAHTLTTEELLEVVEEAQRDKDAASARQAVALAHLSALEPTRQEDGTDVDVHHGLGHERLDAPELAAPRLGVSVQVASNRVTDAIHQLTRTPIVVDAMADGELDERRAAVVTEETDILDPDDAAAVVEQVRPHWAGLTVGPLRRLLARTIAQVAPDAVAAEAERARERRGLTRITGEHGTDQWRGDLAVEHARPAWDAVTERARQLVRDGLADSLAQGRADAMTQLILEHSDVRVVLHATRADATADATADVPEPCDSRGAGQSPAAPAAPPAGNTGWCEVGGLGAPGSTFVPDSWLASAATVGALTCHPVTGALTGGDVPAGLAPGRDITGTSTTTSDRYRIPAAMVRFVRLRDGGCRFPGCVIPARQCDLDHVRPWPTGPTHPANLIALCRRHHRIKQRDGWTLRLHPDATLTWTDPAGATHTTMAVDHLHLGRTADTPRSSDPADTAGTRGRAQPDRPTRHVDVSLLEDHLDELLTSARRHHGRRRPPRDAMLEPVHVDHHWLDLGFNPPPREPRPDIIPF